MFQAHGTNLININVNGKGKWDIILAVFLSMGRWMQNRGQIMKETDGQVYNNSGKWDMGKQQWNSGKHDVRKNCIGGH